MNKRNLIIGLAASAIILLASCDIGGGTVPIAGSFNQDEGSAPTGYNYVVNGEFDSVVGGTLDPGDYNNWNNWNVTFTASNSGWSSIWPGDANNPGYGESDYDGVISWAPKNYNYILTQDLGTLSPGDYEASMMFLCGAGMYEKITLEVIGDTDGSLGSFTHTQDNSQVSESDSNDVTWQSDNWARVITNVSIANSQPATLRIYVEIGDGGINPYTRLDDVFLVAAQ